MLIALYTLSTAWNGVISSGSTCEIARLRLSRNVRYLPLNYRRDLEAPLLAHTCMFTRYVRQSIFVRIDNVIDLHFPCQIRIELIWMFIRDSLANGD